ncbi:uncharacterized protein LOC143365312 [Halictus rubicundus]|uniref:uncharacterized protein LOC143365312 n=1 Tax=Halictus rubicundus TaxID=77578 RepID=UPI0040358D55
MEAKYANITTKENSEAMHNFCNEIESTGCFSKLSVPTIINSSESTNEEYVCPTVDWVNKYLNNLKIQENVECNGKQDDYLAGNINSVIEALNVILVKPLSSDNLLYLGTPLFLSCKNFPNCDTKYEFLGYIDDIFGSIEEPMYSITMQCDLHDTLYINTKVYYFPNNPSTLHMYVEHTIDKISNKRKYRIKKKKCMKMCL